MEKEQKCPIYLQPDYKVREETFIKKWVAERSSKFNNENKRQNDSEDIREQFCVCFAILLYKIPITIGVHKAETNQKNFNRLQ